MRTGRCAANSGPWRRTNLLPSLLSISCCYSFYRLSFFPLLTYCMSAACLIICIHYVLLTGPRTSFSSCLLLVTDGHMICVDSVMSFSVFYYLFLYSLYLRGHLYTNLLVTDCRLLCMFVLLTVTMCFSLYSSAYVPHLLTSLFLVGDLHLYTYLYVLTYFIAYSCILIYILLYLFHIQGVPGGMCQTSGGCSLW
jgi:hypothetical protein